MTINLKIEILKVFSLEFNMSSDNKEQKDEQDGNNQEDSADLSVDGR